MILTFRMYDTHYYTSVFNLNFPCNTILYKSIKKCSFAN